MSTSADSAHVHHAIDYIEISVTDMDAAKDFYARAFGWSLVDYGPEYTGIQGDGREMGGLRRDAEVRPGGPLVILYSEDLERSVEGVVAAGGATSSRSGRIARRRDLRKRSIPRCRTPLFAAVLVTSGVDTPRRSVLASLDVIRKAGSV